MQDRIDAGLDGETPSIAPLAVRLAGTDAAITVDADRYTAIDGEPVLQFYEPLDSVASRTDLMADHRFIDTYRVIEGVVPNDPDGAENLYLALEIYRYEDASVAAAWIEGNALTLLEANPNIDEVDEIAYRGDLGDDAVVAEYHGSVGRDAFTGHVVVVQVDNYVASIRLDAADGVELDPVIELAEIQVAALDDGTPPGLVDVPADLLYG